MSLEGILRKVYRKIFPANDQVRLVYAGREVAWQQFLASVEHKKKKMQIGVRNRKYAPDWVSVDLFDKSPLIDYNYDIQNLPFENESWEAIVCNAVLEHVPYPELALYEFYRVLQPGGDLWLEVPFMQPYHSHPSDYFRVTVGGLKRWAEDFKEITSGIFEGFAFEAEVFHLTWAKDLGIDEKEQELMGKEIRSYVEQKEKEHGISDKVYMAAFIRLQKPGQGRLAPEKINYMEYLKKQIL